MTRYTVVWDKEVEASFMNAWIAGNSRTRAILTEVANWVDDNLAVDAEIKGQPRPGSSARSIDVPVVSPSARISAIYQIVPDDQQVRVIRFVFSWA